MSACRRLVSLQSLARQETTLPRMLNAVGTGGKFKIKGTGNQLQTKFTKIGLPALYGQGLECRGPRNNRISHVKRIRN